MKVQGSLSILVLLSMAPTPIQAGEAVGKGIGFAPCKLVLEWDAKDADMSPLAHWAYGYWSALNTGLLDQGRLPKNVGHTSIRIDPLVAQIRSYCAENPEKFAAYLLDDIFNRLPEVEE